MVAGWMPDVAVQCAFNAWPNSAVAVPIWSDLSTLFVSATSVKRGRQYELNTNLGAQPTIAFLDRDEYLNPANTGSPYWPNVTVYRQIVWQAMWPNGGTGNLLNTGAQGVSYDPTFDSYTAGTTPTWITAVGSTSPVIGTTTPRSGANDLTWTITGDSLAPLAQGVTWPVPCIPGRQYTASAYVRQNTASTLQMCVQDQNLIVDQFQRTVSGGWGTADVGGAWTANGGTLATDYSVAAGTAVMSLGSVNVARTTVVAGAVADSTQYCTISTSALAVGAAIRVGRISRYADANNYYRGVVSFETDQSITVKVIKRVAGTETILATATTTLTHVVGTQYAMRFNCTGRDLRAKVWLAGDPEPISWDVLTSDTALLTAGQEGCHAILVTGNTDTLPVVVSFGTGLTAVGQVVGTNTTTTGAYARISVTWTATQPSHTIQVANKPSLGLNGTILLDDIQHEPGGSASTFTSSGPVIYGVFRGYVERWPATWVQDSEGFLGYAETVCVDSFAPLNKIALSTEIRNAILAKAPDYYWPLNEPSGSVTFGEQSGNSGPSLHAVASNAGVGSATVNPGTASNIAGDPGGVGVGIANQPSGTGHGYSLAPVGNGAVTLGGNTPQWGCTIMGFFTTTDATDDYVVSLFGSRLDTAGLVVAPIPQMQMLGGDYGAGDPWLDTFNGTGGGSVNLTSATARNYADGKPHLYLGTMLMSGGTYTLTMSVDGVQVATTSVSASGIFGSNSPNLLTTTLQVCGQVDSYINGPGQEGTYAHVAAWRRVLSSTEITDLASAAAGYLGETSGARVARYLGYTWNGLTSIQTGQSVMGVSNLTAGTVTLAACQSVTTTENGNFWADARGYTTFTARTQQYLETASSYTFGENTAGGEYPYQQGIVFDFDPTLLYDTVTINNYQGPTVTVSSPSSVAQFFPNAFSRDIDVEDPNEVYDAANFFLANYGAPRQRVAAITLSPMGYTPLWPIVLGLELGMRVTVKRRAKAANQGAGLTMSQDYFVESISHDNVSVDPAAGQWQTTMLLAPVSLYQVGILNDATYGILDQTMILAY